MNLLGIDFEEWYHPELIKPFVNNEKKELKITKGIDKILDWLRKNDVHATFFMVGELLKENPELIDKITQNEHEIAFHSMYHKNLKLQDKEIFSKHKNNLSILQKNYS